MVPLVYHASYSKLALPPTHRFPISKYHHLYQYLLENGLAHPKQFHQPKPAEKNTLYRVHSREYVDDFSRNNLPEKALRRIGFPWSENLLERTRHSLGGTELTAELALHSGIGLHLSGGYHHAHKDFGSGYCIFNDLVFAAHQMIAKHKLNKILIFDCDVHQGDGTATMTQDRPDIVSCSIHCGSNFPVRKPHSNYDIEVKEETQDEEYLEIVEQTLAYLIRIEQPDLILYDAGVDIHQDDRLGKLTVSLNGILQRDRIVLETAKNARIPIAAVIGGGYSQDPLQLSRRHSQIFVAANQIWSHY